MLATHHWESSKFLSYIKENNPVISYWRDTEAASLFDFLLLYHSTPHCSTYELKDCWWNVVLTQQEFAGNKAKGRISKRVFQENKACQIFRKTIIPYLLIRTSSCTYQGARNVRFFGKSGVLCFLDTPALRLALFFCLITDELKIS